MLTNNSKKIYKGLIFNKNKSIIFAVISSVVLAGCQTTSGYQNSNNLSSSTQPQLLNSATNPSVSAKAQSRLVTAFNQHLSGEHVSTMQANYSVAPFVGDDSVDANSQSVFQTFLQTMDYAQKQEEILRDELLEYYIEEIKYEQEQVENEDEKLSDFAISLKANEMVEEDLAYDEEGNKFARFFSNYKDMKSDQLSGDYEDTYDDEDKSLGMFSSIASILDLYDYTPEQVAAMQYYSMQYLTVNSVSKYSATNKKMQSVLSYDYNAPTAKFSVQLPYAFDFEKASATIDPSAFLPIMAMLAPENTPLPQDITSHTVEFYLPDDIKKQVPSQVIFDAAVNGMGVAMNELDSEYFTPVDISDDSFAKSVGAKTAVKVNLESEQMGLLLGKVVKSMANSINKHIDENPETYANGSALKDMMQTWELYQQDFQSKDVGGLMQILESIAPISFNQTMYYYLDANNKLIAAQSKVNIGSEVYGMSGNTVTQVRYDNGSFNNHKLYTLFDENFGKDAPASINGNELIADIKDDEQDGDNELFNEARSVRLGYDFYDDSPASSYAILPAASTDTVDAREEISDEVSDAVNTEYASGMTDEELQEFIDSLELSEK